MNLKTNTKRIVTILLIIGICYANLAFYSRMVLYPQNAMYDFNHYIADDTVDVLCVGSSHVFCGINPVLMYDEYGIAGYDLSAGAQSLWFSYYFIKEALKTQHPSIVLLDVYTVVLPDEDFDEVAIKSNFFNWPMSYNKWKALKAAGAENLLDMFFPFFETHNRYNLLSKESFDIENSGNVNFLGYYYEPRIIPYSEECVQDVTAIDDILPISEKTEEYLRKSIELCQKEGIEIILVNAPCPEINEEDQCRYNYVRQISEEYEIPFLNGCILNEEIGMDFSEDSMGDNGHLNYNGSIKWTKYLCDYLTAHYVLDDRRGNVKWKEWERQSDKLASRIFSEMLYDAATVEDVIDYLRKANHIVYSVECIGEYDSAKGCQILKTLQEMGGISEDCTTWIWDESGIIFQSRGEEPYNFYYYINGSVLNVYNVENVRNLTFDRLGYNIVKDGINLLIYDKNLREIVGKIGFDANNNYQIIHWK